MSSIYSDDLCKFMRLYPPTPTVEPLPEGKYYLVDAASAVEEYFRIPKEVRRTNVDGSVFTDEDLLDVETTSLIACLDDRTLADKEILKHVESVLDDGKDINAELMRKFGRIDVGTEVLNTANQLCHADAISRLGEHLLVLLSEAGAYNVDGSLAGEFVKIREDGLLILRER
jgi:hypothetical protein